MICPVYACPARVNALDSPVLRQLPQRDPAVLMKPGDDSVHCLAGQKGLFANIFLRASIALCDDCENQQGCIGNSHTPGIVLADDMQPLPDFAELNLVFGFAAHADFSCFHIVRYQDYINGP